MAESGAMQRMHVYGLWLLQNNERLLLAFSETCGSTPRIPRQYRRRLGSLCFVFLSNAHALLQARWRARRP